MEKNTFDDTRFLCLLRHVDECTERVVIVLSAVVLKPLFRVCDDAFALVFVEEFDRASAHRHVDDTHADILRQVLHHSSSEVVGRRQSCPVSAKRRISRVPLSRFSVLCWHIHSRHHLESRVDILTVLVFNGRIALHVRLSEAEVDMEIRVEHDFLSLVADSIGMERIYSRFLSLCHTI